MYRAPAMHSPQITCSPGQGAFVFSADTLKFLSRHEYDAWLKVMKILLKSNSHKKSSSLSLNPTTFKGSEW